MKPEEWKIAKNGMSKEKAQRILCAVWKFRITEEFKINLSDPNSASVLIAQNLPKDRKLSSYKDADYLRQTGFNYDAWIAKGFTAFSFICHHIFPGKEWCEANAILPPMFSQTRVENISDEEMIAMLEIIWLRHICRLPVTSSQDKIDHQKRIFIARHEDKEFTRKEEWKKYGISSSMIKGRGKIKEVEKKLAEKFGFDLGLIEENLPELQRWNASRFRKENPTLQTTICKYTRTIPTDLHHLLPRSKFPHLTYHPENVIPIGVQFHAFITRKLLNSSLKTKYENAQEAWQHAPDGKKSECFDEVIKAIVDATREYSE